MNLSFLVLKGLPFPGGVERYMEEVGPRLVAKGHKVRVYSISYRTEVGATHRGMDIIPVPAIRAKSLEKPSAALIAALRAAFDDSEIVHVHAFGPSLFGILPRLARKKVVVQGHGLEWRRAKWGWFARSFLRFSEWASVAISDALTVVSQTQQAYLREKYDTRSVFIPPGISPVDHALPDEIARLGLHRGDYILFAARLEKEKGLRYLIEAYKKLKPEKKLVVAGDNPLDDTYKREMRTLADGDPNVIFTGFVSGKLLQELFSNCYLFALPSELEGLPIAVLEAMNYGCACLVSDIPENREAIGGHGFTFRNKDSDDLARVLGDLLASPDRVRDAGVAARTYVAGRFSWDAVADDLEQLYLAVSKRSTPSVKALGA